MPKQKKDHKEYETGYKKPPENTRFKKGKSGNPRGRPPGAKNIRTVIKTGLLTVVQVRDRNGNIHNLNRMELIVLNLLTKAAQGDLKATTILMKYATEYNLFEEPTSETRSGVLVMPGLMDLEEFRKLTKPPPDSAGIHRDSEFSFDDKNDVGKL